MSSFVEYIIVGQGLAGTHVALELLRRRKSILIIDNNNPASASRVASGLYNPITGKRLVKTWMADVFFKDIETFYQRLENQLNASFLNPLPLYIPFLSIKEQNDWESKLHEESYIPYIDKILFTSSHEQIHSPFGGMMLKKTGFLDTKTFLNSAKKYFQEHKSIREEVFEDYFLKITKKKINYKDVTAEYLILCRGEQELEGTIFPKIPIIPVKGELLTTKLNCHFHTIVNRGCFLIPQKENICKIGTTYEWENRTHTPTLQAQKTILQNLAKFYKGTIEIIDHTVGIRPTVPDRRPILGNHIHYKNMYILNGLGTKGVSIAPYCAHVLIDNIILNIPIPNELNVQRYV
ncbi:MAG: FAD-dependent oxidoreductase [Chitinophagaceae bacterium]|nr:FAD-dependent oxidoreductase [Chitinophagaceae bacterium]